jgi:hypothetical protein
MNFGAPILQNQRTDHPQNIVTNVKRSHLVDVIIARFVKFASFEKIITASYWEDVLGWPIRFKLDSN